MPPTSTKIVYKGWDNLISPADLGSGVPTSKSFLRGDKSWSGNCGMTSIDFGAFPGSSNCSVSITSQLGIVATSCVEASLYPYATADHTADEHLVEPIQIFAGNITPGVGFTIYAVSSNQLSPRMEDRLEFSRRNSLAVGVYGGGLPSIHGNRNVSLPHGLWSIKWKWC